MNFFKYVPSCSICEYANLYIPYFSYPHDDPYCLKGHGKCEVDKICDDFKLINSHFCNECMHYSNNYCHEKKIKINENAESCVYFKVD